MPTATLWIGLLAIPATANHYTLSYSAGQFHLRGGTNAVTVPIQNEPPPDKPNVVYRRDNAWAVWDNRGLTLRNGTSVSSSKLTEYATDNSIFDHDEIARNQDLIRQGLRSAAPSELAGSRRIGQRVFFLPRWTDSGGKPWLEALVEVDLIEAKPHPKLLGRFDGFTTAKKPIDNCLFLLNGSVAAVTRRNHDWGIADYSFSTRSFEFVSIGEDLLTWQPSGLFTEHTAYGSTVGGQIDANTMVPRELFEDRAAGYWIDDDVPPIAGFSKPTAILLRDCETGAEQSFGGDAAVRRVDNLLLAWSPASNPQHAVLLDPSRWTRLAAWNFRPQTRARRARRKR